MKVYRVKTKGYIAYVFNVSHSEAKRMLKSGGIKLNQKPLSLAEETIDITNGDIIQFGRRKVFEIKMGVNNDNETASSGDNTGKA